MEMIFTPCSMGGSILPSTTAGPLRPPTSVGRSGRKRPYPSGPRDVRRRPVPPPGWLRPSICRHRPYRSPPRWWSLHRARPGRLAGRSLRGVAGSLSRPRARRIWCRSVTMRVCAARPHPSPAEAGAAAHVEFDLIAVQRLYCCLYRSQQALACWRTALAVAGSSSATDYRPSPTSTPFTQPRATMSRPETGSRTAANAFITSGDESIRHFDWMT